MQKQESNSYDWIMYIILFRALHITIYKRILHLSLLLVDIQQGQVVIEILLFPKYLHVKPEHFIIPL